MSRFQDWLNSVNGVPIDVDGNHGPQCWDLWSHYAMNLFGATMYASSTNSGGVYHRPGYTCEIWHNVGRSPIQNWFTPHNGTPQRGDVALWEWGSAVGPQSHVAIVVEDRGSSIYCMTQNPGASHYANLSKSGILGYLRPDNQSVFDGPGAPAASAPGGSIAELADAVLRGDYGNGPAREAALGARYAEVQAEVNRRLGGGAPAPAPAGPKQRVIVEGDTLWGIAIEEYGDGTRFQDIFNASNFRSGNPSLIYPGEIAIIP